MKLTIVTGWSPKGWDVYARDFYHSFMRFFGDVKFVTYTEEPQELKNFTVRHVWDIPGARDFMSEFKDDELANGRQPAAGWKSSAVAKGYNFRFDAVKFCRQGFIPYHALTLCDTEYMAWFDADVRAFGSVAVERILEMLPSDKDVAYLGRKGRHSEIGFQLYSARDGAFAVAGEFARLYYSRDIFQLPEWHSAYAFDQAVRSMEKAGKAACHNITPECTHSDVWNYSPLAKFSVHLKGDRKYAPSIRRI
jgi:hypothetical protein